MTTALSPELKALANEALEHQRQSRHAEAAQAYAALLSQAPHVWPACYNLGLVYQAMNRLPDAAEMYQRALQLNPAFAEGYNNLGNVLKSLRHTDLARQAYERALELNPDLSEAQFNLGDVHLAIGSLADAVEPLTRAVRTNPAHAAAHDARYRSLLGLGRIDDAIAAFLDWEAALPPSPEMVAAGLALCRHMADRDREHRYLSLAITWPFDRATTAQLSPVLGLLQYFDIERTELLACYRRYDAAVEREVPVKLPTLPRRARGERLRVGYLSGDFRRHVMGRLMSNILATHDRERFEIYLLSTCPRRQHDALTAELRAGADAFADLSELDDPAAARSISEADLDVLVDLGGHTSTARPGILSYRPARKVVTHLGFHGCLGTRAVDAKFTDQHADLPDAADFQIERPYRLDSCVFPLLRSGHTEAVPERAPGANVGDRFVFATFVNVLKLSARCLEAWRRVLDAAPRAVLLFSPLGEAEAASIRRITSAAGIPAERIAIDVASSDPQAQRARYRHVHAVLDTFPYAGGDTTVAALERGVPVVTMSGHRQSERMGEAILRHCGLHDMIAADVAVFVDIASRLANDAAYHRAALEAVTEAWRRISDDPAAHARALEAAYLDLAGDLRQDCMDMTSHAFHAAFQQALQAVAVATGQADRQAAARNLALLGEAQPDYVPLLRARAELARVLDDDATAADCLSRLVQASPHDAKAHLDLGQFLVEIGAAAESLQVLDEAGRLAPGHGRVAKLRARALAMLQRWEEARDASEVAVAAAPADPAVLFWHATILCRAGEPLAALDILNRVLILDPAHPTAAHDAGVILFEMGNVPDAITVFRRAVDAGAGEPARLWLMQALWLAGRRQEWLVEARHLTTRNPDSMRARLVSLAMARQEGAVEGLEWKATEMAEAIMSAPLQPEHIDIARELSSLLPYLDVAPAVLERLLAFSGAARDSAPHGLPPIEGRPRIGILFDPTLPFSGQLALALGQECTTDGSGAPALFSLGGAGTGGHGEHPITLAGLDDPSAVARIATARIGVLLDLAGHGALARDPAGLSSHGHLHVALPGLTRPAAPAGLRIVDGVLAPAGSASQVTMAGCAIPILPGAGSLALQRDQDAAAQRSLVIGLLAAPDRASYRCLGLWRAVADALPEAVFLLFPLDPADDDVLAALVSGAGIPGERVRRARSGAGAGALRADISLAGAVDVLLDSVPGNEYTAIRRALIDGIPLVSLSGSLPEHRMASSVSSHLGNVFDVAQSGPDYVRAAIQLARDASLRTARGAAIAAAWQRESAPGGSLGPAAYMARVAAALDRVPAQAKAAPGSGA